MATKRAVLAQQLPMFPGAREYLLSLRNFVPVPKELEHRCFVGGLDGREGLYVGNLEGSKLFGGYECVLIMDDGNAFAFSPFSLFPVMEKK